MKNTYPDLSKPLSNGRSYPDLSQPLVQEDELQNLSQPMPEGNSPSWLDKMHQLNKRAAHAVGFPSPEIYNALTAEGMPLNEQAKKMAALSMIANPESGMARGSSLGSLMNVLVRSAEDVYKLGAQSYGSAKLTPGSTEEEAQLSGGIGAGIGMLGLPFRLMGLAAEKINPQLYAGTMAEKIKSLHGAGSKEQAEAYSPIHNEFDPNMITVNPNKYFNFDQETLQYFTPEAKKALNSFKAEPTFKNAHDLQSRLYKEAAAFKGNSNKREAYQALTDARQQINTKLEDYLKQSNPEAHAEYLKGREISKERVYPYTEVQGLKDITETKNKIENYDPKELLKALQESPLVQMSKKSESPISHPLVDLESQLADKMNSAKLYKYGIPAAMGATAGNVVPLLGLGGGTLGGGILGHYGSETMAKLAQNPELIKLLKNAEELSHRAGRGIAGSATSKQE